jgi:hypothetical protein
MAKSLLPAGVENRLKAQVEYRHRLAKRDAGEKEVAQPAPFITISRQFGCNAYALAERLAQRLNAEFPGWDCTIYDRKLLEVLAESEAITADIINSLSERTRGLIADWVDHIVAGKPPETQVFRHLARTFCSIAALGQAILIGRGGAAITRRIPTGIHVRLTAPIEWRIDNLKQNPDRTSDTSMETVKQADKERESFVRKYLGVDAHDPELYHLILNNQLLTMKEQVEIIVTLVQGKCGTTSP